PASRLSRRGARNVQRLEWCVANNAGDVTATAGVNPAAVTQGFKPGARRFPSRLIRAKQAAERRKLKRNRRVVPDGAEITRRSQGPVVSPARCRFVVGL